jgi:hypothetical protein
MQIDKFAKVMMAGAFALGVGLIGITGAAAQAPVPGTIEIHKAECHSGVGNAIFEECHDNVMEDVAFGVVYGDIPGGVLTNDQGRAYGVFEGAGAMAIGEVPGDGYIGVYVYCRDLIEDEVLWDGSAIKGSDGLYYIDIDVTDEMAVVCDWYNITASGEHVPVAGPSAPNTGAGVMTASFPAAAMAASGMMMLAGGLVVRRRR